MFNTLFLSFFIILISLKISVRCQDGYEALHINRQFPFFTFDRVLMKNFNYPKLMLPTAIACPSKSEEEDAFNEKKSLGKKSLFVRKLYEGEETSSDINYQICKNPYQMTVLYHNKKVEFQFGFEAYYDKLEYTNGGFTESRRGDYDLITNSNAYINYIKPYLPEMPSAVSRLLQTTLYYVTDQEKENVGFLWINSFWMKLNFKAKRLAQTIYGLSVTTRGIHKCDNYDLGKEFFNGLNIEESYKENNQKRMLDGVRLPTKSDEKYEEMACESENLCFTKWLSVPDYLFHHLAAKPISCSDLLTVPIWKSTISDVLDKLDNFLFALSIVIGPPSGAITVHSGVRGVLQLPTVTGPKKLITLAKEVIPVPDVIYKLVTYKEMICENPKDDKEKNNEFNETAGKQTNNHDENDDLETSESDSTDYSYDEDNELKPLKNKLADSDENTSKWKKPNCKSATTAIIVVIHNNPYFNPATEKICEDKCEEWGWELIKQRKLSGETITSNYIYCCWANDNNVREKLGIEYEHDTGLESVYSNSNFSLKDFPIYDINTKRYVQASVYNRVIDTYKRLFRDDEFQPEEYAKLNLFMEHYRARTEYFRIETPENDGNGPDKSEVQLDDENEEQKLAEKNADSNGDR